MKPLLIYRFSNLLFGKRSRFFLALKSVNNRLRSGTGKHGRLCHVIGTRETLIQRCLYQFSSDEVNLACSCTYVITKDTKYGVK